MEPETLPRRARRGSVENLDRGLLRALDHPLAFVATGLILVTLFGWTFFTNPGRVAPTKDPAYYTWRTEALLSEEPDTLLEIEGPRVAGAGGMYAGGYRVTAPVIGSFLRRVGGIAPLSTTSFLMVGVPVLTALLLAAFAYQQRRDPLIFHAVAFGTASLYLTDPFVGYLDNILALLFLAAALLFIEPSRRSWPARIGITIFLLLCGLTHPTTLVIFCGVLGMMAGLRLFLRGFDLRSVLRDDGPMLLAAFASVVVTYAIWKVGIWGVSASFEDSALPPPYESSFFVDRLKLWVEHMRPVLNGPLFVIGLVAVLASGRRVAESELTRISIVWLAPLIGLFGFAIGQTYPYYRFFNTTLAWVLLVGIGLFVAARFFVDISRRGGMARAALLGVVALGVVVGTNFSTGFEQSGWNNASRGWLSEAERADLDFLRETLAEQGDPRPVVFVTDSDDTSPRVYGATKLVGNTGRYGLPTEWIDEGYLYLGSLENLVAREPTTLGEETYDDVSVAALDETQEAIDGSEEAPIFVVMSIFNDGGSNTDLLEAVTGPRPRDVDMNSLTEDQQVWVLDGVDLKVWEQGSNAPVTVSPSIPSLAHTSVVDRLFPVVGGLLLLLLPGALAFRWFLRDGEMAQAVGLAPALSIAILTLVGMTVLAVARTPFTGAIAWSSLAIAVALGIVLALKSPRTFTFVRAQKT